MSASVEKSAEWVYRGVWYMIANCFKVPGYAPSLIVGPGEFYREFHPSRRYLDYMIFVFWIVAIGIDVVLFAGWMLLLFADATLSLYMLPIVLVVAILPDIFAYIGIHLRYDTMWYVMTDRTLRVRRGICEILEHTITFENVHVVRGPIQQVFGFSTIVVETAGATIYGGENVHAVGNKAILQGIENPEEIRDLIMDRVRNARSAGLGDEEIHAKSGGLSKIQLETLREIRDELTK